MQGSLVLINEEELSKHTFVKKKHFDDYTDEKSDDLGKNLQYLYYLLQQKNMS